MSASQTGGGAAPSPAREVHIYTDGAFRFASAALQAQIQSGIHTLIAETRLAQPSGHR